jgi:WD40 repeat protein
VAHCQEKAPGAAPVVNATNLAPNAVATQLLQVDVFAFAIHNVTFSADGKILATGEGFGNVRLWNTATGELLQSLKAHKDWGFTVAWLPGGKQLATGGGDNLVHIFDPAKGDQPLKTFAGHSNDVHAVVVDSKGSTLMSAGDDGRILIWEIGTGKLLHSLPGHDKQIPALALSPDDRLLASGSRDDTIRIWDVSHGQLLTTLRGHTNDVMSVKFSTRGDLLASGSYDGTVRIWQVASGKPVKALVGHTSWVYGVAFSPDSMRLASAGDHSVRVWNVETGRMESVRELHGMIKSPRGAQREHISSIAWHPDGSMLAAGSTSGRAYLLDAKSLETLRDLRSPLLPADP